MDMRSQAIAGTRSDCCAAAVPLLIVRESFLRTGATPASWQPRCP